MIGCMMIWAIMHPVFLYRIRLKHSRVVQVHDIFNYLIEREKEGVWYGKT